MNPDYRQTARWLSERLPQRPTLAIILGTGLSDLADNWPALWSQPYTDIPGFPASTAPTHKGRLVLAEISGRAVLCLQGRFHFYEGHSWSAVVFPVRVLAALGVQTLIVTNAAGSLRQSLEPGQIVLLKDHINLMGGNPLTGANDASLGERFPSLNDAYDPEYRALCHELASQQGWDLPEGVYIGVTGPSMETPAECAAFAGWGADLVGMSTVGEVIAARHAGLRVLALSIVTNYSNLFHAQQHSQEEIRFQAGRAAHRLKDLITLCIARLPQL